MVHYKKNIKGCIFNPSVAEKVFNHLSQAQIKNFFLGIRETR